MTGWEVMKKLRKWILLISIFAATFFICMTIGGLFFTNESGVFLNIIKDIVIALAIVISLFATPFLLLMAKQKLNKGENYEGIAAIAIAIATLAAQAESWNILVESLQTKMNLGISGLLNLENMSSLLLISFLIAVIASLVKYIHDMQLQIKK